MRMLRSLVCVVLLVAVPDAADAASIQIQTRAFSGAADLIGVTPFDPGLGSLDRVVVSIDGRLTVVGFAPRVPDLLSFQPYPYSVLVEQDVMGLGGDYFASRRPRSSSWMALRWG